MDSNMHVVVTKILFADLLTTRLLKQRYKYQKPCSTYLGTRFC